MFEKKGIIVFLGVIFISGIGFCQSLEDDWNDFLHYTKIGRFDLAKGYAQKILDSNPDPVKLLELSKDNAQGYAILLRINEMAPDAELADLSGEIIDLIEKGSYT